VTGCFAGVGLAEVNVAACRRLAPCSCKPEQREEEEGAGLNGVDCG
jgi:hypothetical protein